MKPAVSFSRREMLKTLGAGAGAALVGLQAFSSRVEGAEVVSSLPATADLTQPFVLPKLGYDYRALEPSFDARTMEIHHTKHHQAYIDNANKALAAYPDLQNLSAGKILRNLDSIPEKIRTTLRNNVGGHVNHTLFWRMLAPAANREPADVLLRALEKEFGSVENFKTQFNDVAMKRFGSGWAWLVAKDGKLGLLSTANQDSPISEGSAPLLGLDVWEHAYYLQYQNRRADYVAAFWKIVNWSEVAANYTAAIKSE